MGNGEYPRELKPVERDLLLWLLPEDRSGYAPYRRFLQQWSVAAQGRRGPGNGILAPMDERVDTESPLPPVLAYGVVETSGGEVSVTIRERLGNQIEYEIALLGKGEFSGLTGERRRWTYSLWLPGLPCPRCNALPREVVMQTADGRKLVLAVCAADQRLWLYDDETGINHPVPVTNFYNELMLHKNIRDPEIALNSKRLFQHLREFSDQDLALAFRSYNQIRTKVLLHAPLMPPLGRKSLFRRVVSFLTPGKKEDEKHHE